MSGLWRSAASIKLPSSRSLSASHHLASTGALDTPCGGDRANVGERRASGATIGGPLYFGPTVQPDRIPMAARPTHTGALSSAEASRIGLISVSGGCGWLNGSAEEQRDRNTEQHDDGQDIEGFRIGD